MAENDTPPSAQVPGGWSQTPGGGWVPVPDPTKLTTEQLRRELATQREILEAQLQTLDAALEARLDAMDKANTLRLDAIRSVPATIREQIEHLKELHNERFGSIALQFAERDTRTDQAANTQKQALDAALLAAKELVGQQNAANVEAAAKAEASFTKQIDQIGTIIQTMEKAINDRLLELKERIDRGEGQGEGAGAQRAERRLDVGQVIAALAVIVAVIAVVFSAFR
jgi:hypothetical protein